jgi:hypothetical protein
MQTMPERIKKYFFDPALVLDKNRPKIAWLFIWLSFYN